MRQIIVALIWVSLGLIGCKDSQSASRQETHERFNRVLAMVTKADHGIVPKGNEVAVQLQVDDRSATDHIADLQVYRQRVLADAANGLKELIGAGSVSQQVSTRRLLADVYASQVRFVSRQAMLHAATLADQSVTLISFLTSADRSDARARMLTPQEGPLLERLKQDQSSVQQQLAQAEKQSQQLRKQSADLSRKIQGLKTQIERETGEAHRLHAQSLQTTRSTEQYDLQDKSADAERRADIASAQNQELEVNLEVVTSELVMFDKQIDLAKQTLKAFDQQITSAQKRQSSKPHQTAIDAKAQAVEALMIGFNQITQDFAKSVDSEMERATEKMMEAADLLATVPPLPPQDNRVVQLERLAHMVEVVHVLTSHIQATGGHGSTLAVLAGHATRMMPERASTLADAAAVVRQKQQQLIESAKQMISNAKSAADELGKSGLTEESSVQWVKQQSEQLEAYRVRIDQMRLSPS